MKITWGMVSDEPEPGAAPAIHEYAFDIKLLAAVRVKATSEDMARRHLFECLDAADSNLGAWPDGSPILAEVSMDGEADLYEIDGEGV